MVYCYNIMLKKDDNYSRFLVSFAGRYLPYNYCLASAHANATESSSSCDHQLYKIYVPQTESDLFGPVFIEVGIVKVLSQYLGFISEKFDKALPFKIHACPSS